MTTAAALVTAAREAGVRLGTAESLTGGLVCAALTSVPGASASVRGGVVAYAREVKADVLGVPAELLAARGAVDADVALEMATGVCRVLACEVGLATTGVAGPDPSDGAPVGTVYVAVATEWGRRVQHLALEGAREEIRGASVEAVLALARDLLDERAVAGGSSSDPQGEAGSVDPEITEIRITDDGQREEAP